MNPIIKNTTALFSAACFVSACAQHANEIPAQYVSPVQYEGYDCKQLEIEMQNVSARVSTLGAEADRVAGNDEAAMGVGLILFWPALFFLDKNSAQAAEYGRLKGEFDALGTEAVEKKCGFHVEQSKIVQPEPKKDEPTYPEQNARH